MMLTKVQRPALGVLAAVAVTLGMLAGATHADSANLGVVDRGTVRDASLARTTGEEIPSTVMSVGGASGHDAQSAGGRAGSMA